jgi:hypothetical protein
VPTASAYKWCWWLPLNYRTLPGAMGVPVVLLRALPSLCSIHLPCCYCTASNMYGRAQPDALYAPACSAHPQPPGAASAVEPSNDLIVLLVLQANDDRDAARTQLQSAEQKFNQARDGSAKAVSDAKAKLDAANAAYLAALNRAKDDFATKKAALDSAQSRSVQAGVQWRQILIVGMVVRVGG